MTKVNIGQFPARIVGQSRVNFQELIGLEMDIEPFVWQAEISSDRLDAYFTHMNERTLRNFAGDAAAGVTFLDSHNSRHLGYGQSISGKFEIDGEISRVLSDFYTVPGIRFGSGLSYASTDDFIKAVKSRLTRDVSVGFYGGDMICDICGNSFYDWRGCPHWPGVEYPIGEQGEQTVTATFEIDDAHLAEVSAVYDGATPQAMIQKARQQAEAGQLEPRVARILEVKYRIKPPEPIKFWTGTNTNSIVTVSSDSWTATEGNSILFERSKPIMTEPTLEERIAELEAQLVNAAAEIDRLKPLADQGEQYRTDLIAATLAEGVRANGNEFPTETYQGILERSNIAEIKAMRDDWAALARRRFPGGRQTVDDDQTETETQPQPQRASGLPDAAYAA